MMSTMVQLMMQEINSMDLPVFKLRLWSAPHMSGYTAEVDFRSWYPLGGMNTHDDTPEGAIVKLRDALATHASKSCPACGVAFEADEGGG